MILVGYSGRFVFFFKQKTAYEMRISDWSSDVCSSDLLDQPEDAASRRGLAAAGLADDPERFAGLEFEADAVDGIDPVDLASEHAALDRKEIGRASCRERVCQYV